MTSSIRIIVLLHLLLPPLFAADEESLLLSFFRGNGENGVYLAASSDGHTFTALNDDQPVFSPPKWPKQSLTRDPSILYHEGVFHMVWTSNWEGTVFGYANSKDLKEWSEPVMVKPFPESLAPKDQPKNVWAPEIHYDPLEENFFILFSSTTPRELEDGDSIIAHNLDHRTYLVRTKDGTEFTDAKLLFDPGFSVIDPVLHRVPGQDQWVMVIKHELQTEDGGKNLRLAFVPAALEKESPPPSIPLSEPILGPGSKIRPGEKIEGPSLILRDGRWHLYCDAFTNHHYTLITSADLKSWQDETDKLKMPKDLRHGTVFVAPTEAVSWLNE